MAIHSAVCAMIDYQLSARWLTLHHDDLTFEQKRTCKSDMRFASEAMERAVARLHLPGGGNGNGDVWASLASSVPEPAPVAENPLGPVVGHVARCGEVAPTGDATDEPEPEGQP
ncbi:MAG: hypothetical protein ABIK89_13215 [Planctomycetota bacterium]